MNYDELSFVNQQLAAMLKAGIPLEGSLRQLCATMQRGKLRRELELLEADLAKGAPLAEALAGRELPEFYTRMIAMGVKGNNLPDVLLLLADYYSKAGLLWTRLKGQMVYPLIVLVTMCVLSGGLAILLGRFFFGPDGLYNAIMLDMLPGNAIPLMARPGFIIADLSVPVVVLTLFTVGVISVLAIPKLRNTMRWRVPGFREASISQLAMSLGLLIKGGNSLPDALGLVGQLEGGTKVGRGLTAWQSALAAGGGKINGSNPATGALPPLFFWMVAGCGEDIARGFSQAGELYYRRAAHRTEMMLYAVLPVSVLLLGGMIFVQAYPAVRTFLLLIVMMDRVGGL